MTNIIDKMKTPVIQLDIDGNFIQAFESISCAQKLLNNKGIASCICRKKYISKGFIFKQIKKECFLAIAAMRDDTDKNQWFTDGNGYWQQCIGSFKFPSLAKEKLHKATVQELIEHFNK